MSLREKSPWSRERLVVPAGASRSNWGRQAQPSTSGGTGIAVRVDHLVPDEVGKLVTRIRAEQGRLDLLVNDLWGGENLKE